MKSQIKNHIESQIRKTIKIIEVYQNYVNYFWALNKNCPMVRTIVNESELKQRYHKRKLDNYRVKLNELNQ